MRSLIRHFSLMLSVTTLSARLSLDLTRSASTSAIACLRRLDGDRFAVHFEDGGVMDETIDCRDGDGLIGEDPVPCAEGLVGGKWRGF